MQELCFKVAQVEGPLDLILQLIAKHKLDIYDIEITALLEQYLAAIEQLQSRMELSSEFLEMAARLVYIKSVSLLPRQEEAQALKEELAGQLLEYGVCKQMAVRLGERNISGDFFVRRPMQLDADLSYHRFHDKQILLEAYLAVAGKAGRKLPPPKEAFSGIIDHRVVSVGSRIIKIMNQLYRSEQVPLQGLYGDAADRSELVATFLAVLELVKDRRICLKEERGGVSVVSLPGGDTEESVQPA